MATNLQQYLNDQYQDVKVLYVEEEKFSREKLVRVLKRRFANVYAAIDDVEGFQLYQRYQPDLIICDIKMNQMSGLELINKIRALNEQVQVIATSAYEEHDFFIQSDANKINHFIFKPIDLGQLLSAIQKSVYQMQLEKELSKQKKLTRAILDFQDNLIFIIENDEIIEFNQAFTNFTGISKIQTHLHKSKLLSSYFVEGSNYFYPKDRSRWYEEILETGNSPVKVHWKDTHARDNIFLIKVEAIPGTNQYIFVCKDITALEDENRKNRQLVLMDSLTNSINRMEMDDILEMEIRRAERLGHPFSIILMDIDFFNHVNERFGQQAGDTILHTISTIVQQRIRESDIFARWGGEEFILLTTATDSIEAQELAESIRFIIEDFKFNNIEKITCSFGIAEFSKGKTKNNLISEANQALTQSKNKGRNCVTLYNQDCFEGG
ncbi:diguanylate cyclase domain-containing protein [Bacillus sp. AFS031507]|uniref:diguanylate cyclase domain-containing protein n=1 Tax=Bacillus sp. AFS031507 TaxID=2033496 RepID=UPI000BFCDF7D|nr:diguanylate cyclase [Bacillus sp. AFS031507]PGY06501.1 diguanylate cyclase response regulator [Bacillus sp. AFS031507]